MRPWFDYLNSHARGEQKDLQVIDTNLSKQKYWGKTVKIHIFGLCLYMGARGFSLTSANSRVTACVNYKMNFSLLCFLPAWPGHPSPAAWVHPSPPSTPIQRPSLSSGTNARRSSRASARSTHRRLSDTSGNAPCTPSLNLWRFIPARPQKIAGKLPYLLTLWTWVTLQHLWGKNSAERDRTVGGGISLSVATWCMEALLSISGSCSVRDEHQILGYIISSVSCILIALIMGVLLALVSGNFKSHRSFKQAKSGCELTSWMKVFSLFV